MSKQQMIDFLTSLTQDQIFAILESARISLADAEIAFDVGLKVKMSDADINNLQHKIHENMDWDIPEYPVNTTQYWCDSCADPIEIGNEFFYSDLPCDIDSTCRGFVPSLFSASSHFTRDYQCAPGSSESMYSS